jgi:5-methyltetrahydrofolate--homocysteine methyltransferase
MSQPRGENSMNRLADLFADRLGDDAIWLFDGGMGTLLQERGLADGGSGELWNVERPDVIRGIHEEYAKAGATILTTNTFGGTRPRLEMHGLGDRVEELSRAGAKRAREVADQTGALVAGDIGPTGDLMAPLGTMSDNDAKAIFAEQLRGLVAGGIDLVLIETMSDLAEVEAAIAAAQEVAPELPILATLSFDTNLRTMMGVSPAVAVKSLTVAGADAIGANCGRGPDEMRVIAKELVDARASDGDSNVLLIAQSNAGMPQLVGDRFEYDASPDEMARHAIALRDLGVDLIGACCGSTPAHVATIRAALDAV